MNPTPEIIPQFNHTQTISLRYNGDCHLLGMSRDGHIFIEEIYGEDGWLAQHQYDSDGQIVASIDEENGANREISPLPLPDNLVLPKRGWVGMALNFAGARHRGVRETDRLLDLIRPIPLPARMALAQRLGIPSPTLLGAVESYVLAETLIQPQLYLLCRRIRLAIAMPTMMTDAEDLPYDYDTIVIYVAHFYDSRTTEDTAFTDSVEPFSGIDLVRPMDCQFSGGRLIIAEGGEGERQSCLHIWITDDKPPSSEEILRKKIYGA